MIFWFLLTFLCFNIMVSVKRFLSNPVGSLLNPLFYLIIFSSLYLLLPTLYLEFIITVADWNIPDKTLYACKIYSVWYCVVFFIFYLKSKDSKISLNTAQFSSTTMYITKWINILLCCFIIFIIIKYVPTILAVRSNRVTAFSLYSQLINEPYRFRIIIYSHIIVMSVLLLQYKKLKYLLPVLGYLIIDYSHGGRTVSIIFLAFTYFFVVLITKKNFLIPAIIGLIILLLLGVTQRTDISNISGALFTAGAEFSNTYLTTVYSFGHPEYQQNWLSYFVVSITKFLPGGMVDKLLDFGEWYGPSLSQEIGMGYGLAGNLITEALVYGGRYFAILNPILIGSVLFIINSMSFKKCLFGLLYTLILCLSMQVVVRQYFWGFILYPIQLLWFYNFWLIPEFRKKVLK